ncbi:hypothetical protein AMS69_00365 [Haloarcula rubripromontorii]|uniref:Uncharacterized protein n=1 Tax=Haloarcula rubripromontorii TaxID=1705562 RepID=A0A0N0BPS1_9EURY|nr:hypothetical protein [Haloarcula rubripromontorii]KOX94350.1 hypothetical protein AMS69_00365 [Haloarcula rubripromontorii]NLV07286.1 hypothetical protein [Haloarcula rubripromontorii]
MRWLSTAAVTVLLLTAGCNAFADTDNTDRPTVTPAPVPTAAESDTVTRLDPPPGVTTDRLENIALLAAAHRQAVNGTTYTLNERYSEFRIGNDSSSVRRAETVTVESPTRYRDELVRITTDSNATVERYEQSTYADGTNWYERRDNGTVERQRGEVQFSRDKYAYRTAFYLNRYAVVNQSTTTVVTRDGSRAYRIRGSGGEIPATEQLREFRVELLVEPAGLVRRFSVWYRTEDRIVEYSFWYEDIGETTVQRPTWLNESTPAN